MKGAGTLPAPFCTPSPPVTQLYLLPPLGEVPR